MRLGNLILFAVLLLGIESAWALNPMQPAATVNDRVITVYDLHHRIDLTLLQTNSERTKENRIGIASRVLENLINEHLHLGEAERLDFLPSTRDIDAAVTAYEEERNIPSGGVKDYLTSAGVDFQSFIENFRANLAWQNVVQDHLSPQIEITDSEIARELKRMQQALARNDAQEARLMLILLPYRDSAQAEMIASAEDLRQNILAGAQFSELARQLSADISAQYGGDLGWLPTADLSAPILSWLANAQTDEVSPAIALPEGVALFKLREKRQASATDISEETVRGKIGNIKLQSKIRALERTLRQEAIIDHKLNL